MNLEMNGTRCFVVKILWGLFVLGVAGTEFEKVFEWKQISYTDLPDRGKGKKNALALVELSGNVRHFPLQVLPTMKRFRRTTTSPWVRRITKTACSSPFLAEDPAFWPR